MQFNLTIECDNAAFAGNPIPEIVHLLEVMTTKLQHGSTEGSLLDTNGNTVATYELKADEGEELNGDQHEAARLVCSVPHLHRIAQLGGSDDLDEAFTAYVTENDLDLDVDNIDFVALMED